MTHISELARAALSGDTSTLIQNSYRDFHAKGLDYVCLKRTPDHTVKVYFLDGDVSKVPEVVNPHDHRYAFETTVLSGEMLDHRFLRCKRGAVSRLKVYQAFDYRTPLNGGDGFTFRGEECLTQGPSTHLVVGRKLYTEGTSLHTIQMLRDQTVLVLEQFEDYLPVDQPTSCWVAKGHPAPDTSGLYERFTEGQFRDRLIRICQLSERLKC